MPKKRAFMAKSLTYGRVFPLSLRHREIERA